MIKKKIYDHEYMIIRLCHLKLDALLVAHSFGCDLYFLQELDPAFTGIHEYRFLAINVILGTVYQFLFIECLEWVELIEY